MTVLLCASRVCGVKCIYKNKTKTSTKQVFIFSLRSPGRLCRAFADSFDENVDGRLPVEDGASSF